jgi:hypothetical protein
MEHALGILVGVCLAAACGFRVFVPLLVLGLASRAGMVHLSPSLAWVGQWPAITAFGVAAAMEIIAYKVPWLDHALDTLASPAAVVAGTIAAASQIGAIGHVDPLLQWSSAIIAGGGAAGLVQATSVSTRAASTIGTGGIANPIISALQSLLSIVTSILAVVAPIVAMLFLAVILFIVVRLAVRIRRNYARGLSGSTRVPA